MKDIVHGPRTLLAALILQTAVAVSKAPAPLTTASKIWPPWFTYTEAQSDPAGPTMIVLGELAAVAPTSSVGRQLAVRAYRCPPKTACQILIGIDVENTKIGTGTLVPHPIATIPLHSDSNGVVVYELQLPLAVAPTQKLYIQIRTKVAGKVTLTNAVTVDFSKVPK